VIPGAILQVTVGAQPAGTTYRRVDVAVGWRRKEGEPLNTHLLTAHLAGAQ
jgi:hypothetical protein